ncbi:ANTAR domain-containing protein [Streptomyces olivaceiscleroticus]|uniref:ANTAR domain-containing protein n=1 Tax=Streptomyces olivaceiscleroticus TaxID=68245 RepID=A0ABN0ZID1_9ACTN
MNDKGAREIWSGVIRLPAAAGWLQMLGADGMLESADHPLFSTILETEGQPQAVAVDLSGVRRMSGAAARALAKCATELGSRDIHLMVAAPSDEAARALAVDEVADSGLVLLPEIHDLITACVPDLPDSLWNGGASAAVPLPATELDALSREELDRLRGKVRDLQAKVRTHPLVAQAQGVLQERYRLRDGQAAFTLLQTASQRHNVKLRSLASAVLSAPRPEQGETRWFPDRVRTRPPKLTALRQVNSESANRGAVISAVLHQTLLISDTAMGNVQLADRHAGGLRIEKHQGLNEEFVDYFDVVGKDGTSCAQAARNVTRVTVTDVATDPVFSEEARYKILQAGSRAAHSTPLTTGRGICLGMVSSHHERPVHLLGPAQARAMDRIGDQAGRWLAWHQRTVVLDALEHLHRLALSA